MRYLVLVLALAFMACGDGNPEDSGPGTWPMACVVYCDNQPKIVITGCFAGDSYALVKDTVTNNCFETPEAQGCAQPACMCESGHMDGAEDVWCEIR